MEMIKTFLSKSTKHMFQNAKANRKMWNRMEQRKIRLIEPVIGDEEIQSVTRVLRSGWLTEGPLTKELEQRVKDYVGAKFAVAATSCTTALEIALRALGVGRGDEVIIPDFTHPATGNIVRWIGATPVLVDVESASRNINSDEVEKAITAKTRCILPVSWGGHPLDVRPLNKLKEQHDFSIIEDAACSLGAEYNGKKTGTMGDITCFSFHPRKVVTCGEGGMTVTDNAGHADKLAKLKKFGIDPKASEIRFVDEGTNYKLSDALAAIGVEQMKKVDTLINRRIELAKTYDRLFADVEDVETPVKPAKAKHTYQTYAIHLQESGVRNRLIAYLKGKGIEAQIGTYALHLQPSYARTKKIGKLANAADLYENLLAVPMCHSMTEEDQERVVSEIKSFLGKS